jgi:uncharacterized protein YndB with AHSA1/START domain
MTARNVVHGQFTISRNWKASPERVFAAFATEEGKAKWFAAPGGEVLEKRFDFREGGHEMLRGKHANGMITRFDCVYQDIVSPGGGEMGRIVYSYVMHLDGKKISVSQACIEIRPEGGGTKLVVTEYGDFLDGYDDNGSREHGTNYLMDQLGKSLGD